MERKKLPVGFEDYREVIDENYYYVDKTLLVKELLDAHAKVTLFTRPRRFGKSLNLSMLRYFFEKPVKDEETGCLFEGMKIQAAGSCYMEEQGKYPVIMLSLKSGRQAVWETALSMLKLEISREYRRHSYVEKELKEEADRQRFRAVVEERAEESVWLEAVAFLSRCLEEYHGKQAVILVDEYDVPLENAYYSGFYEKMLAFIRPLFESAFKTNASLKFAVVTGCLRISRESIFTGLNNLDVVSILSVGYSEHFGFVQTDVDEMLAYYGLEEHRESIRRWYDGYLFGSAEVYNPWSVINHVKALCVNPDAFPVEYWSNTSSNSIVKDLICRAGGDAREEIENLIGGGSIKKKVYEDITYEDIYQSQDTLWNFLFFTGYLKAVSVEQIEHQRYLTMKLPNIEICNIYKNQVADWFREKVQRSDLSAFYSSLLAGKEEVFQRELQKLLGGSISYMDSQEAFYHGFLMGLLLQMENYKVISNREAGDGRYDLCITSRNGMELPLIMEFKVAKNRRELERAAEEALCQIAVKHYDAPLEEEGYEECLHVGVGFCKKMCRVKMKKMKIA